VRVLLSEALIRIPLEFLSTQGEIPMKTFPFLNHQEIFDHAIRQLLMQDRTALLPRGGGA
jgi:hypothetical protein